MFDEKSQNSCQSTQYISFKILKITVKLHHSAHVNDFLSAEYYANYHSVLKLLQILYPL